MTNKQDIKLLYKEKVYVIIPKLTSQKSAISHCHGKLRENKALSLMRICPKQFLAIKTCIFIDTIFPLKYEKLFFQKTNYRNIIFCTLYVSQQESAFFVVKMHHVDTWKNIFSSEIYVYRLPCL